MDSLGEKLLKVAQGELGYSERASGYTKYGNWYYAHVDGDPYFKTAPWCDMFVTWAAHRAGLQRSVGSFAYTPSHARWFKKHHAWGHRPEPGSLVFLTWSGGHRLDDIDHVGLVERVAGHKLHTIEANVEGGRLKREVRDESQAVGYGYPSRVKVPGTRPAAPPPVAPPPGGISTSSPSEHRAPVPDQNIAMSGLLAMVVLGTVVLALGKAKVPVPAPAIRVRKRGKHHRPRVRPRLGPVLWEAAARAYEGPHTTTPHDGIPSPPPSFGAVPPYEEIPAGPPYEEVPAGPPGLVPPYEKVVAGPAGAEPPYEEIVAGPYEEVPGGAGDVEFEAAHDLRDAGLWEDLEDDEELAFWDTVHTAMTGEGPPPLPFGDGPRPLVVAPAGRGRQVAVAFDDVPVHIAGRDGLAWDVQEIIGFWQHPDVARYGWAPGYRAEAERWHLGVAGPLPGRPDAYGEQRVILRAFGGESGWYLAPAG